MNIRFEILIVLGIIAINLILYFIGKKFNLRLLNKNISSAKNPPKMTTEELVATGVIGNKSDSNE